MGRKYRKFGDLKSGMLVKIINLTGQEIVGKVTTPRSPLYPTHITIATVHGRFLSFAKDSQCDFYRISEREYLTALALASISP
jgi:hypothetical protein